MKETTIDIPEFPDWLCLEWDNGNRMRVAMSDIPDVIEVMDKVDTKRSITPENFGSFIAALVAYVEAHR